MQDFRQLRVWRHALTLALDVRETTSRFPKVGYTDLRTQMLRAAESVAHNIVEGCGASSQKEFARFLEIAIKSTMELEGQLHMAHAYRILSEPRSRALQLQTVDTRRMLVGLRKKILASLRET